MPVIVYLDAMLVNLNIFITDACVWFYLGHSKLMKITSLDREEMKKREKEMKKRKDEEEESRGPLIWIKYTLGLKHQVRNMEIGKKLSKMSGGCF